MGRSELLPLTLPTVYNAIQDFRYLSYALSSLRVFFVMTGTDGHSLPEETSQTLDMFNVDKIDHSISLTQAQRNYFVAGNLSPENLNILNLAIDERNRTRIRLEGQDYPAGRSELIRLGPREFSLPNQGYAAGSSTSTVAPTGASGGARGARNNVSSSNIPPPPSSRSIPATSSAHTSTNNDPVAALVQMFQNLSPSSIQRAISALSGQASLIAPPTVASTISSNTFERNLEQPASVNYTECYNQVPPQIDILRARGLYIPLTCFLNVSWKRMHTAGDSLTYSKRPDQLGGKSITVLNVDQFGVEENLSLGQWTEAWKNYGTFLDNLTSKHALHRWLEHYKWIIGQSSFNAEFNLYRAFDIKERQTYIHDPRSFDSDTYHHRFQTVRLDILSSSIANLTAPVPSFSKMGRGTFHNNSASGMRSNSHGGKPYDRPPQKADFPRSFLSGTSAPSGSPSCLVCSRAGHRYNVCKFGKFPDDSPLFSRASESGLVSRQHAVPLCISYNVGGTRTCKGHLPSSNLEHRCSFCGDANHFALSFSCRLQPSVPNSS